MDVPATTFHLAAVNYFLDQWSDDATTLRTPVKLRNKRGLLTTVDGQTVIAEPPRDSSWVEFMITEMPLGQAEFGSSGQNHAETLGHIVVEMYVPQGVGEYPIKELQEQVKTALVHAFIANVHVEAPEGPAIEVGNVDSWYRHDIQFPYIRPEHV